MTFHFDPAAADRPINRRRFLSRSAVVAGGFLSAGSLSWAGETPAPSSPVPTPRYRIAVCDWMILKRQKLGAFPLTKEIGADGVEVDMGSLGDRVTFDSHLNDPAVRQQFHDTARELGLGISSIAMSGFYAQSFAERPGVERMVQDCIDTMTAMHVK